MKCLRCNQDHPEDKLISKERGLTVRSGYDPDSDYAVRLSMYDDTTLCTQCVMDIVIGIRTVTSRLGSKAQV